RLVVHPRFDIERDAKGRLIALSESSVPGADRTKRESLIQIHVDRIDEENAKNTLVIALEHALAHVRRAVDDWKAMLGQVNDVIAELINSQPVSRIDDLDESVAFLRWLMDDNFTFLGVRDYVYNEDGDAAAMIFDSALGVLRGRAGDVLAADRS